MKTFLLNSAVLLILSVFVKGFQANIVVKQSWKEPITKEDFGGLMGGWSSLPQQLTHINVKNGECPNQNKEHCQRAKDSLKLFDQQENNEESTSQLEKVCHFSTQVVAGINYRYNLLVKQNGVLRNCKVTMFKSLPYLNKADELTQSSCTDEQECPRQASGVLGGDSQDFVKLGARGLLGRGGHGQRKRNKGVLGRQKRSLLGGEQETHAGDEMAQKAAQWAVEHINRMSNSMYMQALLRVSKVTKQVINGYRYHISLTTAPTSCRNSPDNHHKTLEACPVSNSGKAKDCEVTVVFSLGKYNMEDFKCAVSENYPSLIGAGGHDFESHGVKPLLGGGDHDLKPHGAPVLGGGNHDYKIHSGVLGGDSHDFVKHGARGLLGRNGHGQRKVNQDSQLTFGSGRIGAVKHMSILGGDDHDLVPHIDSECHQYMDQFKTFKVTYMKLYGGAKEEAQRFSVFCKSMQKVEEIRRNEQGTATYGATQFADMSEEEFRQQYLGLKAPHSVKQWPRAQVPKGPVPDAWDWREHGAVTDVKNQGQCGSCWAFSTTGNVEGQWAIHKKQLLSLSEQELVDCDKVDEGCNGGLPSQAYDAIMSLGGLETEKDYGYEGADEKCKFNKTDAVVKVTGAVNISSNEADMAAWLYKNGPISIGINAAWMQFYFGGVAHPWKFFCNPKELDHGVLIVGYGVEGTKPYWIVKNSWGPSWGRKGYYYVYRGDGTCGLNNMCTSATVE